MGVVALLFPLSYGGRYITQCTTHGRVPLRDFWQRYYEVIYSLLRKLKALRPERSLTIAEVARNIGDSYLLQFDNHNGDVLLERSGSILKESLHLSGLRGETLYALGFYHFLRNEHDRAVDCLERSMEFPATKEKALGLLVQVCSEKGERERALAFFRSLSASHRSPIPNMAYYVNAWLDDFAVIWRSYIDYRTPHPKGCSRWEGEPLAGKRLLLVGLSGLGDEIRFSSAYPELIAAAGSCVITCEPRLHSLFRRSFPSARVLPSARDHIYHLGRRTSPKCIKIEKLTGVDYYTNSFRALEFIRPHASSFAGHNACLVPDAELVKFWREQFASGYAGKALIGLCWRSGINSYKRRRQHFDLASLMQIFEGIDCALINLQYDGDLDWRSVKSNSGVPAAGIPERRPEGRLGFPRRDPGQSGPGDFRADQYRGNGGMPGNSQSG